MNSSRAAGYSCFSSVNQPQVEMNEGQLGIAGSSGFEFRLSLVILIEIEMIFPDEEMVVRRTISNFDEALCGAGHPEPIFPARCAALEST